MDLRECKSSSEKMSENGGIGSRFPHIQGGVPKSLILSKTKDVRFTIIEDCENQQIFTLAFLL